jgi:YHS domain-containing protein
MRRKMAPMCARFKWFCVGLLTALLGGCGTPWATVPNAAGDPVMLLGHDPVAYFTEGQAVKGMARHKLVMFQRTYHFASNQNRYDFIADPSEFEPQYSGFCAHGAAFGGKLGSDPTRWQVVDGRLYIFSSAAAQAAWSLDPAWYIGHADRLWPIIQDKGWRSATWGASLNKVPHHRSLAQARTEWEQRHPGQRWPSNEPDWRDWFKPPGWRAAEGVGQPALGYAE